MFPQKNVKKRHIPGWDSPFVVCAYEILFFCG